jgi:hypothetical protein
MKREKKVYNRRWILMYSRFSQMDNFEDFDELLPPEGRFWADPHIYRHAGKPYIFFEDASVKTGHGRISCMRIEDDGRPSTPLSVLERPYHLSYPFIFEWQHDVYMIPESADNSTVELYRFVDFPGEVEFVKTLMKGIAAFDATLFEHDGLWWMFVNLRPREGASSWDELHLFYSDSPVSTAWQPHASNPVISDVRSARPAGSVYEDAGSLIRPSQNSSYRYGYGIKLNRIIELTPERYREETVRTINPDWSNTISALHTVNRDNDLVVIDAIHKSPSQRAKTSVEEH